MRHPLTAGDDGFLYFVLIICAAIVFIQLLIWFHNNYKTRVKVGIVYRCKQQYIASIHIRNQTVHCGECYLLLKTEITRPIDLYSEYTLLQLDSGLIIKVRFYGWRKIYFRDIFEQID